MNKKAVKTMIPILGFMLFFIQGDSYATSPLLIRIANDFGVTISQAGLTAVAYMIPFGLFTILFGPLGDKFGKIKLISFAAFGTTIFSALGAFAPNLTVLIIYRAVNGIFAAAVMPVSMALIGEASGNDQAVLHKSLTKTMALMFFGGALAPLIGGVVSYFASWRMVYLMYGAFELLISILIVVKIRFKTTSNNKLTFMKTYSGALKNRRLMSIVTIMSLLGISVLAGFTYIGKYVQQNTGITIFQVGLLLSCYGLGTVIGGKIAPKVKKKLKERYFIFSALIGVISLLLIAFFPNIYVLTIALLGYGLTFTLIQPMLIALAQSSHPKNRGTVMSLASFNMCLGAGLGSLLYGYLIKSYSFNTIYVFGAVILIFIPILTSRISKFQSSIEEKIA